MRHTLSFIVAAIAPLAVIAAPATTATESIPGSGQSQMSGDLKVDTFAARKRAKNTTKRDLSRRARLIRPRTNTQGLNNEGGPGPES